MCAVCGQARVRVYGARDLVQCLLLLLQTVRGCLESDYHQSKGHC